MQNAAIVLIDIQNGFDDLAYWGGERNNPEAENNAAKILDHWRKNHRPIFHVKHDSVNPQSKLAPGQHGNEIKHLVTPQPNEPVIRKHVNSAFIGTNLDEQLKKANISKVIFFGLTTDHCVSTSARMAGNFGYETYVVADASATFNRKTFDGKFISAEEVHRNALASLHGEFATVITTEALINQ